MSRLWLALLLLLLGRGLGLAEPAPWPGVPYAEVRAYAWKSDRPGSAVVLEKGVVAKGALKPKGEPLSEAQRALLLKAQARRYTPRPVAMCYVPHHAFVFYDQAGKPVAWIEVCLDCLGARVYPKDPECDPDYLLLGELCAQLELPLGRFKTLQAFRAETAPVLGVPAAPASAK